MLMQLTVQAGPLVGSFVLRSGQSVRVGHGDEAEIVVPHDAALARLHCVVQAGDHGCRVRDLGSPRGTWVQGQRVSDALVHDGMSIGVGSTLLWVRTHHQPQEPPPEQVIETSWAAAPEQGAREPVDRLLRRGGRPLFAVLDPARAQEIRALLGRSGEEHGSLLRGRDGQRLATHAPQLVELPMGSPFLGTLLDEAWGKSWGILLASEHPYEQILAALQRVLIIEIPGGKSALFRFYDPRVLRAFLPVATRIQADLLFAAARSFWIEGPTPGVVLSFSRPQRQAPGPEAVWG